jgi:hypothetical protein
VLSGARAGELVLVPAAAAGNRQRKGRKQRDPSLRGHATIIPPSGALGVRDG